MENNKLIENKVTDQEIFMFIVFFLAFYHGTYIYMNYKK
jgi:hypothetical protein